MFRGGCKLLMKSGHIPMISKLYQQAMDGSKFSSNVAQYTEQQRIHGMPHGIDVRRHEREAAQPAG